MRISREWLEQYINLDGLDDQKLCDALTSIGLEVEHVERVSPAPDGVVVGRIIQAVQHPNADSLRLCKVDVGSAGKGEPLQIVCGATNAREGIHVAVAMVGAELPGDFKIKEAKIRGEKSFGMMCSEKELGISDSHEQIIELSGEPKLGLNVGTALGLDNIVMTLNVTPNRADCLSYIGVARDLSAKLSRPVCTPKLPEVKTTSVTAGLKTRINGDVGARFCGIRVEGVKPVASPAWLQQRLLAAGMRPINAIVDTTNYVMLETGQPIHAYDERDVCGNLLEAKLANGGEKLTTLDNQTRILRSGDIVICDEKEIIGLAGIMGGANSEVKDDTSSVFIEVAHFHADKIRATSKRLGLRSEASHRFERGVDLAQMPDVALRAADILCEIIPGAKITGPIVDSYPVTAQTKTIALRVSRARQILALPTLSPEFVTKTMTALGLKSLEQHGDELIFAIPSWRHDLDREADLVEEIARMIGFDAIPYELPVMALDTTPEDPAVDFAENARVLLAQAGLRETISFPFQSATDFNKLRIDETHALAAAVKVINPLSEDSNLLQTTLLPGLLKAAMNNERHGRTSVKLFEFGRGYLSRKHAQGAPTTRHLTGRAADEVGRPVEKPLVAAVLSQPATVKTWAGAEVSAGFFEAKKIAWQWLTALGIKNLRAVAFANQHCQARPYMHPRASCIIQADCGNSQWLDIGYAGEIHPETAVAFDFAADQPPVVFEFDFDAVITAADVAAAAMAHSTNKTIYKFPPSTRDIALLVPTAITHADFSDAISAFPRRKNLRKFRLFDVYEGSNLAAGTKSMAYTLEFQSSERTLTDTEVEQEVSGLLGWLSEKLEAKQR